MNLYARVKTNERQKSLPHLPSEIAASVHCQYSPSRLDWPHMLAAISIEVQKSELPTLFNFARVRAAHQPHVKYPNKI